MDREVTVTGDLVQGRGTAISQSTRVRKQVSLRGDGDRTSTYLFDVCRGGE